MDLKGLVEIEASARIDSARGAIRATFANVPDAPIARANVKLAAHSAKRARFARADRRTRENLKRPFAGAFRRPPPEHRLKRLYKRK